MFYFSCLQISRSTPQFNCPYADRENLRPNWRRFIFFKKCEQIHTPWPHKSNYPREIHALLGPPRPHSYSDFAEAAPDLRDQDSGRHGEKRDDNEQAGKWKGEGALTPGRPRGGRRRRRAPSRRRTRTPSRQRRRRGDRAGWERRRGAGRGVPRRYATCRALS